MIGKKAVPDDTIFILSQTDNKKPAKPNRTICRSFAGKRGVLNTPIQRYRLLNENELKTS